VFNGKPYSCDRWEIQWTTFVDLGCISGFKEAALNADMPEDASVVLLTDAISANAKGTKDNKKCIAYYQIALKQLTLPRLLTHDNATLKMHIIEKN
jgi:hypothetical protein